MERFRMRSWSRLSFMTTLLFVKAKMVKETEPSVCDDAETPDDKDT